MYEKPIQILYSMILVLTYIKSHAIAVTNLPYSMRLQVEFSLAALSRMVKFTEFNICKLLILNLAILVLIVNFSVSTLHSITMTVLRGGTSRENPCRVGYRVRKEKSGPGPGRVYPMRIGKIPQYFQACLMECQLVAKRLIGQQSSDISYHNDLGIIK